MKGTYHPILGKIILVRIFLRNSLFQKCQITTHLVLHFSKFSLFIAPWSNIYPHHQVRLQTDLGTVQITREIKLHLVVIRLHVFKTQVFIVKPYYFCNGDSWTSRISQAFSNAVMLYLSKQSHCEPQTLTDLAISDKMVHMCDDFSDCGDNPFE